MKRQDIEDLWKDNANWRWGIVYCCPEDPRVIVPRRWRWGGWTLNFCHPKALITGVFAFLLATVPGIATLLIIKDHRLALAVMALSIAAVIFWAHAESSKGN